MTTQLRFRVMVGSQQEWIKTFYADLVTALDACDVLKAADNKQRVFIHELTAKGWIPHFTRQKGR